MALELQVSPTEESVLQEQADLISQRSRYVKLKALQVFA